MTTFLLGESLRSGRIRSADIHGGYSWTCSSARAQPTFRHVRRAPVASRVPLRGAPERRHEPATALRGGPSVVPSESHAHLTAIPDRRAGGVAQGARPPSAVSSGDAGCATSRRSLARTWWASSRPSRSRIAKARSMYRGRRGRGPWLVGRRRDGRIYDAGFEIEQTGTSPHHTVWLPPDWQVTEALERLKDAFDPPVQRTDV